MTLDFLNIECLTKTDRPLFGIRDGKGNTPSFICITEQNKWVVFVENPKRVELNFHAIDSCIEINRRAHEREKRCDAMLTYEDSIIFIELKEVNTGRWIKSGTEQLASCIQVFSENHELFLYKNRRAFLANRKHPSFKFSHKAEMEKFRVETGVRLIIHNKIKIK